MSINKNLPNFETLFGELDFKKGEAARSVYSPAAYLADLLQLLDDYFAKEKGSGKFTKEKSSDKFDFDKRRTDIKALILNGANTFDLVPYLDIVNELLEKKIGADPYNTLKKKEHPFKLPFSLENERLKKYLSYLDIELEDVYKAFQTKEDPKTTAKAALALSEEQYKVLFNRNFDLSIANRNGAIVQKIDIYINKVFKISRGILHNVSTFLETTGLSGQELRMLLRQNLGAAENNLEQNFYVNAALNGYAKLDEAEENIIWAKLNGKFLKKIPEREWFARVSLLVKLAKIVGLTTTELDLIIRRCGNNKLDDHTMEMIAILKELQGKYDQPIAELVALFGVMEFMNQGEEDLPQDLFNRIFNNKFIEADKLFLKINETQAAPFKAFNGIELKPVADFLSIENNTYRKRLCRALHISDKDLKLIYEKYEETIFAEKQPHSIQLNLCYRLSKIAELTDSSIGEIFDILDLLDKDEAIRKYPIFDKLLHKTTTETDAYAILAGSNTVALMWLVPLLFSLIKWIQKRQIEAAELKYIQKGIMPDEKAQEA